MKHQSGVGAQQLILVMPRCHGAMIKPQSSGSFHSKKYPCLFHLKMSKNSWLIAFPKITQPGYLYRRGFGGEVFHLGNMGPTGVHIA